MKTTRTSVLAALTLATTLTLTGCVNNPPVEEEGTTVIEDNTQTETPTPNTTPGNTPSETDGNKLVATPVIMSLEELKGATVTLPQGNIIDINVPGDPSIYTAVITNEQVATFATGTAEEGLLINPGILSGAEGTTTVTLTDTQTGETTEFTVTVIANPNPPSMVE
jgi:hypothetical protein